MKKINFEELNINPYKAIAKDWMLITAGNSEAYNTMTASWGQIGSLWGHNGGMPVTTIYVRPQRYTKKFVDENEYYSLCFFDESFRKDLGYLGSHSGKDEDKVSKTNMHPVFDSDAPYFKEASLVLICRKLYAQEIKEELFIDKTVIDEQYPSRDFHTMYIGEITEVLVKD